MADASKAHKLKLANSRKRFKELQELKKKKYAAASSDIQDHDVQEPTLADSLTSSTHSSINAEQLIENSTTVNTPLPNYFTNTEYADNSVFFDTISQKNKNVFNSEIIETPKVSKSIEDNYSLFNQTNVPSYVTETQQIIRPNADSVTIDDPEIRPNEIFEHHQNTENNLFSEKNRQNLIEYLQGDQHSENVNIKNGNVQNLSKPSDDFLNSSPMSQFVHEYNDANSITDLEKRNIELTTLLENERTQSQDQKLRIAELEEKVSRLEGERALKEYNQTEISNLQEELQCHTQTIRLLVAEKTELSNDLTRLELNFKNKNSECDELQARLKASRSRAFEFEQELNGLKSERVHKETNGHDQNVVIENLKTDFNKLLEEKEELHQDLLEVREKLKSAIEEVSELQKSNSELSGKLSLADVKIQQLTSADHHARDSQVDQLVKRTVQLENEVAAYEDQIKNVSKELNESTNHYQRYTEDLNSQLATIQEQYQQLLQENENLSLQEQSRVRHISDLERQLQSIQNDRVTFSSTNLTDSNLKNELDVTRELCIQLQVGFWVLLVWKVQTF